MPCAQKNYEIKNIVVLYQLSLIQFRETQQIGDEDLDPTQKPEKVRTFATMPIGKIDAFDEANDDWNAYVERMELYFIANEIDKDKQVAVMLSLMGNKTYGLLRNLAAPAKPSTLSFKTIVDKTTEASVTETTSHSRALPLSQTEPTRR